MYFISSLVSQKPKLIVYLTKSRVTKRHSFLATSSTRIDPYLLSFRSSVYMTSPNISLGLTESSATWLILNAFSPTNP